jgi:lysophospholipase L1-like esterase
MLQRIFVSAALGLALSTTAAAQSSAQTPQTPQTPPPAAPTAPATATAPRPPALATTPSGAIDPSVTLTEGDLPQLQRELARIKTRLDDWPAIARYAKDNATVTPPAAGESRVVFLGDSITDAWDDPKYGGFFPGKPYINRGISGQSTPQMVLRMPADVLALAPKVIVLLAGTNDIAGNTGPMTLEQIEGNIQMISELAKLHGATMVLSSILPTSNYHYNGERFGPQTTRRPPEKIRALNAWLKAYAEKNGHVYLDYYAATVDANGMLKTELSSDDLHPNAAGYAIMAPLAEAAIAKALAGASSGAGK